jgi:hypothetical protein
MIYEQILTILSVHACAEVMELACQNSLTHSGLGCRGVAHSKHLSKIGMDILGVYHIGFNCGRDLFHSSHSCARVPHREMEISIWRRC